MIYSLIGLVLFFGLFYLYLQSKMFTVFHVNVQSKKVQGELRLIQITDYHGNPWIDLEKLKTNGYRSSTRSGARPGGRSAPPCRSPGTAGSRARRRLL